MPAIANETVGEAAVLAKPEWTRPEMKVVSVERTLNSGTNATDVSSAQQLS